MGGRDGRERMVALVTAHLVAVEEGGPGSDLGHDPWDATLSAVVDEVLTASDPAGALAELLTALATATGAAVGVMAEAERRGRSASDLWRGIAGRLVSQV